MSGGVSGSPFGSLPETKVGFSCTSIPAPVTVSIRVGNLIWNLIGEGTSLADLVEAVRSGLTDAPADLQRDVETFVADLVERDLLTLPAD